MVFCITMIYVDFFSDTGLISKENVDLSLSFGWPQTLSHEDETVEESEFLLPAIFFPLMFNLL